MSSRGFTATKQIRSERRKRAEERNALYNALSLQEKLDRLPSTGAKKQRERLTALLNKAATKSAQPTTPVVEATDSPKEKKSKKGERK